MPAEEGQKLRHVCSTCSRPFSSKRDLIKHQYMHHEKPQLVCSHCNKTFITESNYKRHLNSLQNNEKKRYSCNNCGKPFRRLKDLEAHHDSEHKDDKVFRCGVCQAEFSWHENLLKHEQVHDINPHVCGSCGRKFVDLTSLLVHKRTHHHLASKTEHQQKSTVTEEEVDASHQIDDGKPFTCHICGRGFKFDFSYQAHLDGHVIPVADEDYYTDDQASVNEPPVSSSISKAFVVQMDSEGIIDLPALNGTDDEEVEIIVEMGNVTSGAITISSLGQENMTNNTIKEDSDADDSSLEAVVERKTVEGSSSNINKHSVDQAKVEREEPGRIITFYEPDGKRDNERLPSVVSRAEVVVDQSSQVNCIPGRPYSSRPKKPPKRKRERTPFQFNCVMTDDKPFICSTCGEAFRWEISLQVHTKGHTDGKVPGIRKVYMSGRMAAKKIDKTKNGSTQKSGVKKSRIVYQRHSSEEEEEEDVEDAYAFRNDREQDKSPSLSYHHAKKLAGKKFAAENADDMLQEYLAGGDDSASDDGCDDAQSSGETTKCEGATRAKYQNDDSWKKGKAILRKKRTWKVVKLKPSDDLQTNKAKSDKPVSTGSDAKLLTSGDEVTFRTECNIDSGQNFAVTCIENSVNGSNSSQFSVVGSCLMASFPCDLTAVADDDKVAMAAAYSVIGEPVSVPVVIQNGFKQEDVIASGEQLTMLQCVPIQTSSVELEDAVLNSGTLIYSAPRDAAQEFSTRTSDSVPPLVQNVSPETTTETQLNENNCTLSEPTAIEPTVSHVVSEFNIAETCVSQVDDATTRPNDSKLGNSTQVIFFADENPISQFDKNEEPLTSYTSVGNQSRETRAATNFGEIGISAMNQKISAGLVALKAIVTGAHCISLKENSDLKSNYSSEGEFIKNPSSVDDVMISNSRSENCFQNKKEQALY